MDKSVIIIIVTAVILAVTLVVIYIRRKPKSNIEIVQSRLQEAEKNIRKQKEMIDKAGKRMDLFTNEVIKKNDELLKKARNQL